MDESNREARTREVEVEKEKGDRGRKARRARSPKTRFFLARRADSSLEAILSPSFASVPCAPLSLAASNYYFTVCYSLIELSQAENWTQLGASKREARVKNERLNRLSLFLRPRFSQEKRGRQGALPGT